MTELNNALEEDPDNPEILFYIGFVLIQSEKLAFAYHVMKRVVELAPHKWEAWNNLARTMLTRCGEVEVLDYLQTAAALAPNESSVLLNTAVAYINLANAELAEAAARKGLEVAETDKARDNLAIALLAQRKWEEGFKNHEYSLGGEHRTRHTYNNSPDWDGQERSNSVVVYGEQGLGDEILYASCVMDAINAISDGKIILNVDKRLRNLFARSFPEAVVYGDRKRFPHLDWVHEHNIVAQSSLGQLATLFRKKDEDFTGKPYLIPDPMRMTAYDTMIQRHVSKKGRARVGIAWKGGKLHTRERAERSMELEMFLPLIDPKQSGIEADWFILEYDDAGGEVADFRADHLELADRIHYFPWILQSRDYDDTAALVAQMDHIIAVPTTVIHLAGAMEVPTHCLVPTVPQWRFGFNLEWENFPWHSSVRLFRTQSGETKQAMVGRFIEFLQQKTGLKQAAQS